jgi:hypothetical protein
VVAAIDQLILKLSIPQMWNLERNISGYGPEIGLIIISSSLNHIKKEEMDYRLHALLGAEISQRSRPKSKTLKHGYIHYVE